MSIQFTAVTNDLRALDVPGYDPACVPCHLCTANGVALLRLLRLEADSPGMVDMPLVRRSIMWARATFDRHAPALIRPAQSGNVISPAFTSEHLRERLESFALFVEHAAAHGACSIAWD